MFQVFGYGQKRSYLSQSHAKLPHVIKSTTRKHKYFHNPQEISRFYSKYSHEKPYLSYEDILEALLPHQDYLLISNTLTNPPN